MLRNWWSLAPGAPGPEQVVKQIQEKMEAGKMQVR